MTEPDRDRPRRVTAPPGTRPRAADHPLGALPPDRAPPAPTTAPEPRGETLRLADLPVSDIYLFVRGEGQATMNLNRVRDGGVGRNRPVPPEYAADLAALRQLILREPVEEGVITDDGTRWRFAIARLHDRTITASLRRITDTLPVLEQLGFEPTVLPLLQALGRRRGLILVARATGDGKTTTAVALLHHFLRSYGEVVITLKDPVEYVFPARVGRWGTCSRWRSPTMPAGHPCCAAACGCIRATSFWASRAPPTRSPRRCGRPAPAIW